MLSFSHHLEQGNVVQTSHNHSPTPMQSQSPPSKLKDVLRRKLPPLFQALKTTWTLRERLRVSKGLEAIERLKALSIAELRDPLVVEGLIKAAGLHTSGADKAFPGQASEWPKELDPFIGKGIQIWQYPSQFSNYLAFLSQFPIHSYLEIGVSYGGTFVFTVDYLTRINTSIKAFCIDVRPPSLLIDQYAKTREFAYITDKSSALYHHLDPKTHFDLVLVDGDHSRKGVMEDFLLVKDKANIIAFHDIVNFLTPGAVEAWLDLKSQHADEFDFFEFTQQYAELTSKQPENQLLGIGVAVKKDMRST
jgi:hypothetical protein